MTLSAIYGFAPFVLVALIAITFHEAAHACVAAWLGDDTARSRGRVTLNPLKHIDLVGTILLPALLYLIHAPFLFGYAKPVPVNGSKLRHPKRDMMLVAAAGPGANLLLAILFSGAGLLLMRNEVAMPYWLDEALGTGVWLNLWLAIFNLIPIPPLDGSKVVAGFLPDAIAARFLGLGRRHPPTPASQPTDMP